MIRVYLLAAFLGLRSSGRASGEEVFKQRCAGCHEANNPRIPRVEVLHRMPAAHILRTLNWGVMGNVAYTMSIAEREAVASYLGTHDPRRHDAARRRLRRSRRCDFALDCEETAAAMEWLESLNQQRSLPNCQACRTHDRRRAAPEAEVGFRL